MLKVCDFLDIIDRRALLPTQRCQVIFWLADRRTLCALEAAVPKVQHTVEQHGNHRRT